MAELQKPSTPIVSGKTVSVEAIAGAVKYTLYRVRYVLKTNFGLLDKRFLAASDGAIFKTKDSAIFYKSTYTGEQIDEVVKQTLSESST